jgi:hypothetical protein
MLSPRTILLWLCGITAAVAMFVSGANYALNHRAQSPTLLASLAKGNVTPIDLDLRKPR